MGIEQQVQQDQQAQLAGPTLTWPPDQKWFAGAIMGAVSWAMVYATDKFGWTIPAEIQSALPWVVSLAAFYLIPPSVYDVVKRVNNTIVAAAARDMSNSTRAVIIPKTAPTGTEAVVQAAVNKEVSGKV